MTPAHYIVGQEGVALVDEYKGNQSDITIIRSRILDIPLWCSHKSAKTVTFEWVTRLGRHRKAVMLRDTLTNTKQTVKWLACRGVVGFVPTRSGMVEIRKYMSACVAATT